MPSFVRFIILLVVLGILLNLGIVFSMNFMSARRFDSSVRGELEKFAQVVERMDGRLRRAEMAVEWQRLNHDNTVLETSLLVRRFVVGPENELLPTAVQRIQIPGNRVCVDGLVTEFDALFTEQYAVLRNRKLFFFGHVYAEGQPKEQRFSFMHEGKVPIASQVHIERPTHLEVKLWRHLWTLMQNERRAKREGFRGEWTSPACRTVRTGMHYEIFLGDAGVIINEKDDRGQLQTLIDAAPPESRPPKN